MIYVFKSQLYEFVQFSRVQQSATRHRVSEKNRFPMSTCTNKCERRLHNNLQNAQYK